jgi:hypothetical protein
MSRIRLYVDEDAMQHALIVARRAGRVDVVTAADLRMVNHSDEAHLRRARDTVSTFEHGACLIAASF